VNELPESVLRRWPGRFRFARLIEQLAEDGPAEPGRLSSAVLDGLIDGHNESQAVEQLITEGRFRTARRLLGEYPFWDRDFKLAATRRIKTQTARFQQNLAALYQTSRRRAEVAGVPWPPVLADLMEQCVEDWPAVQRQLDTAADGLSKEISRRRTALKERIDAEAPAIQVRKVCDALLRAEQLEAVIHLLEHGSLEITPPEAIDPLPRLLYPDPPSQILRWFLGAGAPPRDFRARWTLPDDGHELLVKFGALDREKSWGEEAARAFAVALSNFLTGSADEVTVDPVEHGYLATLPRVLDVPHVSRLLSSSSMQLLVCEPEITSLPQSAGIGPHVLVGYGLTNAERAGRADGAVLALEHLLPLAAVQTDRAVAVLRIIGPQWSPASLGAGSPAQLGRVLGRGSPWDTLAWLTDLAGLGGSVTAAQLGYLSGEYEPHVLFAVLNYLMQSGPHPHVRTLVEGLARWWEDADLARRIEEAVTAPVRANPDGLLAFWAALDSAIPGQQVTLDDLVVTCALADATGDLEPRLRAGLAELARRPSLAAEAAGGLCLQPSGAITGLRNVAAARLRSRLTRVQEDGGAESAEAAPLTIWRAYRFALRPGWDSALAALTDPAANHAAVERELVVPVAELLTQPAGPPGPADVPEAVRELFAVLRGYRPELTAALDGPETLPVAVSRGELLTVLFELLDNAAEAITGPGRIRVTVQDVDSHALIDVSDSGIGILDEIEQEFRVFRPGVTTKGDSRGQGLHLARQLVRRLDDGELTVTARRGDHPVLRGARFRVVLPRY
jgi:signal transduction histidine kinase